MRLTLLLLLLAHPAYPGFSIATFEADVTPKVGEPVAYVAARSIEDPLYAKGIVITGSGKPIVLCAVDWIGIGNTGHDVFRQALAKAAGTDLDRVMVHTLHQHDGPRFDPSSEAYLARIGLGGKVFSDPFGNAAIARTADALRKAIGKAQPVTHLQYGKAKVDKVASNRRILGPDGKVKVGRMSASKIPEAIAAPEGTIDPYLQLVAFYHNEKPLAVLTYYATHPQSYYGKGDVTSEFVGLARAQRQKEMPGPLHIHFNGASGNVAAGKYNDGSTAMRPVLTSRMAAAMKQAFDGSTRVPAPASVQWRTTAVSLPKGDHIQRAPLTAKMNDASGKFEDRREAAIHLAWLDRVDQGHKITLAALSIADMVILHMPGELFVEYQLVAQQMRPDRKVLMAAYGDFGPGYIGTAIAYTQGGYEVSERATRVGPGVETVLRNAMKLLLGNAAH